MQNTYFAASNSGAGFVSYYGELFTPDRFARIYLIKGGPGTGKSSLMRHVAEEAERRGLMVRRYLCSSDSDSLDGIAVGDDFAMLDATAPHSRDCTLPGAVDALIDLGQFWDATRLARSRDEIAALSMAKKAAYARAYGWLAGVAACDRNRMAILADCVDYPKLRRAAARSLTGMTAGQGSDRVALIDSVGMRGVVKLESMHNDAERSYILTETRGGADLFLREIAALCHTRKLDTETAWDAVTPELRCGIALPNDGVAFLDEVYAEKRRDKDRVINFNRFWLPERLRTARAELRHLNRCRTSLLEGAAMAFDEVRAVHFALEQIYVDAMNFDALTTYRTALIEKIFA